MRRRRKYDLYIILVILVIGLGYFIYNSNYAEKNGVSSYSEALKTYKKGDWEQAYKEFGQVPLNSGLKQAALFRQARCATNLDRKDIAIKKYKSILNSDAKTTIVPISAYNMANLLYETEPLKAKGSYKKIIKKYPSSDYAIASNYYLGMIEVKNPPSRERWLKKSKEQAKIYFKTYLEHSPDGRYAVNCATELENLKIPLNNYDNLLIAQAFYYNGDYEKAKKYLNKTTFSESWADFAKNEYKLNNKAKANEYTEKGLKEFAFNTKPEDINELIDSYVTSAPSRKEGINKLLALNLNSNGADYVAYLNCNEVVKNDDKKDCYAKLYEKYPNGQYSADALYNVFITKYLQKKYYDAQKLGYLHLKKFPKAKSAPAVCYYMGKIAFKLKHYESSNNYYKQVLDKYPDSYYAFRASNNLYKDDGFLPFLELTKKPVIFPYKRSLDGNLVVKLAFLKDYDLVEELCKRDKFIQSWIAYEKGDYTVSAVLARNAMEELDVKPPYNDLRWRLVYPAHYYDIVSKLKGNNNPIIIEAIIKEESHFNPYAKSAVGATGLMQLMPATYNEVVKKHNIPNTLSPEAANIAAGSLYYSGLKKALVNKDLYAITAYNGGIGSVTNWFGKIFYNDTDEFVEQIPYPETKNYVKKVLRSYWMYGNIY